MADVELDVQSTKLVNVPADAVQSRRGFQEIDATKLPGAGEGGVSGGSGAPDPGDGVDGDMYLDRAVNLWYGPKAGGAWGVATVMPAASVTTSTSPTNYDPASPNSEAFFAALDTAIKARTAAVIARPSAPVVINAGIVGWPAWVLEGTSGLFVAGDSGGVFHVEALVDINVTVEVRIAAVRSGPVGPTTAITLGAIDTGGGYAGLPGIRVDSTPSFTNDTTDAGGVASLDLTAGDRLALLSLRVGGTGIITATETETAMVIRGRAV